MQKIVKLNKRHVVQLAIIDSESERENRDMKRSKLDLKKKINSRFSKGEEFFGLKLNGELIAYMTLGEKGKTTWFAVKQKYKDKKLDIKLTRHIQNYYNKSAQKSNHQKSNHRNYTK